MQLYEMVLWDRVPVKSIVLGLPQSSPEDPKDLFRNLYFRFSARRGCLVSHIYENQEEGNEYCFDELISWKQLGSLEAKENQFRHVIILDFEGSVDDEVEKLDYVIEQYKDFARTIEDQHDELLRLFDFYKGTALIKAIYDTITKFNENNKKINIRPRLSVVPPSKNKTPKKSK